MPDLTRFRSLALGAGVVPPVPPFPGVGGTRDRLNISLKKQILGESVPPVPPVPPENSMEAQEFDLLDLYEERAAIMEYDGGLPRHEAEARAWVIVFGDRPKPSSL
jgi:hypothetical protein